MKTWCRILVLCSLIISLVVPSTPLMACGPISTSTIFSYSYHPDFPLGDFAGGKLGIIEPEFMSYYLPVAYRYLIGKPLSAEEQKAVVMYWRERINPSLSPDQDNPLGDWLNRRKWVPGAPHIDYISQSRLSDGYYFNCTDDAFRTASDTLSERISMFGEDSEEVRQWLAAQDAVFKNCEGGQTIPPPAPANMPPLIKADRAYQIAAACFYSGNFDEAEARFRKIARDTSSPWSKIAPYLAARAILRKSSVEADYGKNDMTELARAEKAFKQILQDKSLAEFHDSARGLLNLIEYRRNPEGRLKALSARLLDPKPVDDTYQLLKNYIHIFNNQGNKKTEVQPDDMTDWIRTVKWGTFEHALEKWKETRSLPWLVAALMKRERQAVPELIEAADGIGPDSPAYLTVAYERAAALTYSDKPGHIREEIDSLLKERGDKMPLSAYNRFRSLLEHHAKDLREFLTYAKKRPVGIFVDYDGYEIPFDWKPGEPAQLGEQELFDFGTVLVFNQQMPVELLVKAASSDVLPEHLRARLAVAAWTRAVLLDEDDAAVKLASMIRELVPELADDFSAYFAASGAERKFIAQYIILRNPGMNPNVSSGIGRETPLDEMDNFRDNWWCFGKTLRVVGYPDFITASQQQKALDEWTRVTDITTASYYLTKGIISWAKSHPGDSRVPEALHRAVMATRYGCGGAQIGALSKEAFTILHKRYPDSPWTKETPYWFD